MKSRFFILPYTILLLLLINHINCDIENDLLSFLEKIKQSKRQQENSNSNINNNNKGNTQKIKVIVEHDLRPILNPIYELNKEVLQQKSNILSSYQKTDSKLDQSISSNTSSLNNIKDKYEAIINSNLKNEKEFNDKKADIQKYKSDLDSDKADVDLYGEKFISNLKTSELVKEKTQIESNSNTSKILKFNSSINKLNDFLNSRKNLQEQMYINQLRKNKEEIKYNTMKDSYIESNFDSKFFNLISSNIHDNKNRVKTEMTKKIGIISDLKNKMRDKSSIYKFEIEKNNQKEILNESRRNIKSLNNVIEKLNKDTNSLLQEKSKLRKKLNSKELEGSLKLNETKDKINMYEKEIEKYENQLVGIMKGQKEVSFLL